MSTSDLIRIGIWLLAIGVAVFLLSYWQVRKAWPRLRAWWFQFTVTIFDRLAAYEERIHRRRCGKHRGGDH